MERAEKKGSGHTEVAPFHAILSTIQIPCGIGVQGKIRRMSRQILIVALCADHSPVITAQPQRRQVQPAARLTAGPLQIAPDDGVGCHASGGRNGAPSGTAGGLHGTWDQLVADGDSGDDVLAQNQGRIIHHGEALII